MTNESNKKKADVKVEPKKASTESGRAAPMKSVQEAEIEKFLVAGEEVILKAELHNAIYWKAVAVLLLSLIVWIYVNVLGIFLAVVGAIMLIIAILTQHFLILAITNKRVLARYGLLQMDVVDIRLSMVESIDLERMLPGHLFSYANVVVMGTGMRQLRVPYIANAEAFRRYYNEMVLANEGNEEAEAEIKETKKKEEAKKKAKKKRAK